MFYVGEVREGRATIRGDAARHLRKVLRAEPGQRYEISDQRHMWLAEISRYGKDLVEFTLLDEIAPPFSPVRAWLLPALIKFDHFEWLLEKATEFGVERITPVYSLRCDKGLDHAAHKRAGRWRRILHEAGQQSRRLAPPLLDAPVPLAEALQTNAAYRLWLDEMRQAAPLLQTLPATKSREDVVAILAGPEGGWDPRERDAALSAGWTPASLGPHILRAETACAAALAVVNAAWLSGCPDSE
jgi:16S rRNA (uracil1498-N3)-methyltransferase